VSFQCTDAHCRTGTPKAHPYAADYVQQLIAEFNGERDHGLRCWLLDLIGQSGSPEAFQFLIENLRSDDERLRSLAVEGLRRLNTQDARRVLWEVGQ
jgi:HEAT repeat protein